MKIGQNPRLGLQQNLIARARVFVIVYIPDFNGFFSRMREVLDLCLASLERTLDPAIARVSLISNGCCSEVEQILLAKRSTLVDQVILHSHNLGKVDGLMAAARGALEEVVVLSDCDILFRKGWLQDVLRVFEHFPEAGACSPIASPRQYGRESHTTLTDALLRREVSFVARMPPRDFEILTHGAKNPELQTRFMNLQPSVVRDGAVAGLGISHQCIAFRREVLTQLPMGPCRTLLNPDADRLFLDRPPDELGFWRLSTPTNGAFHMGNVPAEWMSEIAEEQRSASGDPGPLPKIKRSVVGRLPYPLRKLLGWIALRVVWREAARKAPPVAVANRVA